MPTQVGAITGTEGTSTLLPAVPTGTSEGDIVIVIVTEYNSSDPITSGTTVTGGSAFTRIVAAGAQDGPEPMWVQIFAKVAGDSEPGTYTVSAVPSPGYRVARCLAYDGDDTDPTILVGGSFGTGDDSADAISLTGITFTEDGSLGLVAGHEWDGQIPAPDGTWAEVGAGVGANHVWTKAFDSGATGTLAWNASGNTGRAAAFIGLQPLGSGGPTVVREQTAMPDDLPGDKLVIRVDGGSYVGEPKLIYFHHGGLGADVGDLNTGGNVQSIYDTLYEIVENGDGEYIVIAGDDGVGFDDGIESYSNGMSYGNATGVAAMDAVIGWARTEFGTSLNVCVTAFSAGGLTGMAWVRDNPLNTAGIVGWDAIVDVAYVTTGGLTKMPDYLDSAFDDADWSGDVPEAYAPGTTVATRPLWFVECTDSTVPNGQGDEVDSWWSGSFTPVVVNGTHHQAGNVDVATLEAWLAGLEWEPFELVNVGAGVVDDVRAGADPVDRVYVGTSLLWLGA